MTMRCTSNRPKITVSAAYGSRQKGMILIEALVAILIFAIGVLGVIALQAAMVKQVGEAKYRIDAANLTEQLIGQMWADNHTTSTLAAKYASANGSAYLTWKSLVENRLPGAAKKAPTVTIVADSATSDTRKSTVTLVVYWQAPGSSEMHNYSAVTQIR